MGSLAYPAANDVMGLNFGQQGQNEGQAWDMVGWGKNSVIAHPQDTDAVYEKTHKIPGPTPIFTSLRLFHPTTPAPPRSTETSRALNVNNVLSIFRVPSLNSDIES